MQRLVDIWSMPVVRGVAAVLIPPFGLAMCPVWAYRAYQDGDRALLWAYGLISLYAAITTYLLLRGVGGMTGDDLNSPSHVPRG